MNRTAFTSKPQPKRPEPTITWRCNCGENVLSHIDWCPGCSNHRSQCERKAQP